MIRVLTLALRPVGLVNDVVERVAWTAGVVLLAFMTISILLQVYFRYVLGDSLNWTAEAGRFMMVWLAFIMAPVTVRRGANVGIALITASIRGRPRMILDLVITGLIMATVVVLFLQSLELVERGLGVRSTALGIQMAYFYAMIPTSLGAIFLVGVEIILLAIRGLFDPQNYRSPLSSPEDEEIAQDEAYE